MIHLNPSMTDAELIAATYGTNSGYRVLTDRIQRRGYQLSDIRLLCTGPPVPDILNQIKELTNP